MLTIIPTHFYPSNSKHRTKMPAFQIKTPKILRINLTPNTLKVLPPHKDASLSNKNTQNITETSHPLHIAAPHVNCNKNLNLSENSMFGLY